MDSLMEIREISSTEISLLDHFLYEAIFVREGQEKPDKKILDIPELSRYIKDFGNKTDLCLVADLKGEIIGAIWARIFSENEKGFGYVDSKTPELSMSVDKDFRQQGVGTELLKAMISKLTRLNYEQVSLSVDKQNYAYKLYEKLGFNTVKSDEKSAVMLKQL